MAVRRRFSAAFKRQVVEEVLAGAGTMAQVCRRYELCQTVVRTWREHYRETMGRATNPGAETPGCTANRSPGMPH